MKSAYFSLIIIIAFSLISVAAQTTNSSTGSENKLSSDNIFDDIMRSLPADVKSKLDSVAIVKSKDDKVNQKKSPDIDKKTYKGQLDGLSDDLKIKVEKAMQENGKIYEKVIYPNTDHAFHNDTGSRYNPEAAQDAWGRALAWFEKYVRG
jgi:dienelactone hydrolase